VRYEYAGSASLFSTSKGIPLQPLDVVGIKDLSDSLAVHFFDRVVIGLTSSSAVRRYSTVSYFLTFSAGTLQGNAVEFHFIPFSA